MGVATARASRTWNSYTKVLKHTCTRGLAAAPFSSKHIKTIGRTAEVLCWCRWCPSARQQAKQMRQHTLSALGTLPKESKSFPCEIIEGEITGSGPTASDTLAPTSWRSSKHLQYNGAGSLSNLQRKAMRFHQKSDNQHAVAKNQSGLAPNTAGFEPSSRPLFWNSALLKRVKSVRNRY